LVGNLVIWLTASLSVLAYVAVLAFYLIRRRRQCFDIPEGKQKQSKQLCHLLFLDLFREYSDVGGLLLSAYLLHFLPFFFYDRTLFLHHYLTAYVFKLMLAAFVASHVHKVIK